MSFPFEVPEDLTALSAEQFAAFRASVTAHAHQVATDETIPADDVLATADLFSRVNAEYATREERSATVAAARASLAAETAPAAATPEPTATPTPEPAPTPDPEPEPAPVDEPAPTEPETEAVTASRSTIDTLPDPEPHRYATLTASMDAGPAAGTELQSFAQAGEIIERRLSTYGGSPTRSGGARPLGGNRFAMGGRTLNRHGVISFNRTLPDKLRITDVNRAMEVLEHARNEARLRGGSLLNAMQEQVLGGKALTAAAGWCAPSETIYDLCALETLDGILDLPTVQATRGGFNIPENGGVDFSTIWNTIGDDGDVILSEYDVENGVDKVCVEIPCPDFVEVRLDVAYICITGALLQRRGYPEAVTRFSEGAMVALAHKVNQSVISRMVAQSGSAITVTPPANNTDGASQILAAAELAAVDMRYRFRMSTTAVLEMVLPVWALAPIRAAISRRAGVAEMAVTDAEILNWFRIRNIAPRFVYDWQDAYSGLASSPGGSAAITAFPANVSFLIYPAGTWVKAERDVVNLDTVYDNALLTQNQFTALFAEDGFNVLKMCADSRLYTTALNPAGVTGQPA